MAESRSNKSKDVLAQLNNGLSNITQSTNAEDGNFSMCKTNASGRGSFAGSIDRRKQADNTKSSVYSVSSESSVSCVSASELDNEGNRNISLPRNKLLLSSANKELRGSGRKRTANFNTILSDMEKHKKLNEIEQHKEAEAAAKSNNDTPVEDQAASSPTAETEISTSHGFASNSDQMRSESEIDDVSLYPGSMEKRKNLSSDKTLSSTEVANVLFAEFEDKLNRTLRQFDVHGITETQRVRAVLKSKNEKLKENIDNLERQLASATLANYIIRNALGCDADAITDSETIETIRSVNHQEKFERESTENITENPASKNQLTRFFTEADTPRKVVALTVKRLYESSIIKLPDNCMKKIKISTELAVNDKSIDANSTIFTLTDDNVKELLDRIIETAGVALDNKDKMAAPNNSRSNKANSKQGTTSSVKRKQPAFVTETSTRKSTRGSRSSTEEALIDPIKYFDCQICSKKSFYTEKDLKAHSDRKHAGN